MFKLSNFKIGTRLNASFVLLLLLLMTIGYFGWQGLSQSSQSMEDITYQLEIAKKANRILVDAQDAQAGSLRFIIYHDEKYFQTVKEEGESVIKMANEAKTMMKSEANRKQAQNVVIAMTEYEKANIEYAALHQKKIEIGTQRTTAARMLLNAIKSILDKQHDVINKTTVKSDQGQVVDYGLIERTLHAQEIRNSFNRVRIFAQKYQLAKSPEKQDQVAQDWLKEIEVVRTNLLRSANEIKDPKVLEQIGDAKKGLDNYLASVQAFRQVNQQQRSVQYDKQRPAAQAIMTQARNVRDGVYQFVDNVKAQSEKSVTKSISVMVLVLVISLILAIVCAIFMTITITGPINKIVERIKDIAEGEGDLTQRVDENRKDEVGDLAKWFNVFVNKIHGIINEFASSTNEVASAATEIAASSEEMARGISEQEAQTLQVSSAIEEMSSTVAEVAQKSSNASTISNAAGKIAKDGGEVVQHTIESINTIATVVQESAVAIQELGERSEQIGQIIEVINDIADQTNLLALNAAIEAARAGEHGRGFAVVADEVRKLADRTTKATKEIASSILAIQDNTKGAVERMNYGTQCVQEGVDLASQSGQVLNKIMSGSEEVANMIQSIAAAAEEQASASDQIARNVEAIASVTKESSQGVGQSVAAATQLSQKSEELRRMVGQFKL